MTNTKTLFPVAIAIIFCAVAIADEVDQPPLGDKVATLEQLQDLETKVDNNSASIAQLSRQVDDLKQDCENNSCECDEKLSSPNLGAAGSTTKGESLPTVRPSSPVVSSPVVSAPIVMSNYETISGSVPVSSAVVVSSPPPPATTPSYQPAFMLSSSGGSNGGRVTTSSRRYAAPVSSPVVSAPVSAPRYETVVVAAPVVSSPVSAPAVASTQQPILLSGNGSNGGQLSSSAPYGDPNSAPEYRPASSSRNLRSTRATRAKSGPLGLGVFAGPSPGERRISRTSRTPLSADNQAFRCVDRFGNVVPCNK